MFSLPKLPYSFDALEPFIDAKTMEIHYTKHHQAYLDKLYTAVSQVPDLENSSIEELLTSLPAVPEEVRTAVRNNGGGYYNHTLFWNMMAPPSSTKMSGTLKSFFDTSFGGVEDFKKKFAAEAVGRFGSGWVWLIKDHQGKYSIQSTPNQDSPLMENPDITLLLGLDVWEHAYYLKYQNRRPEYIEAWWNIVNWHEVERKITNILP